MGRLLERRSERAVPKVNGLNLIDYSTVLSLEMMEILVSIVKFTLFYDTSTIYLHKFTCNNMCAWVGNGEVALYHRHENERFNLNRCLLL
jgi:hypothetical protein